MGPGSVTGVQPAGQAAEEAAGQAGAWLAELRHEFHQLCQPMAALQCRLELGRMMGDEGSLREAVDGGLDDMQRLMDCTARVRGLLSGSEKEQAT